MKSSLFQPIFYFGLLLFPACLWAQEEENSAGDGEKDVVNIALEELDLDRSRLQPDPIAIMASRTGASQAPMLRALLSDPLNAGYRVGMLEQRFRSRTDSPHRMFLYACGLTGANIARGYYGNPFSETDSRLLEAEDPLAAAMERLEESTEEFEWRDTLPAAEELPNPLRYELARVVATIASSEKFRQRALRNVPIDPSDSEVLLESLRQIFNSHYGDFEDPDYRLYIKKLEEEALYAGMLDLVLALEDFENALAGMENIPKGEWKMATPLGEIIISTVKEDSRHVSEKALLIVDLGGSDQYELGNREKPIQSNISLIYDEEGNDDYTVLPGRGASGLFGYGIQWDNGGDDRYRGSELTQAAAVFGAAMLLDRGGDDEYIATRGAQGYGVGGTGLLVDLGDGNDRYEGVTYCQASAEPHGAGVLFDGGGDDVYTLKNEPLLKPSAQSPEHNTSMGQGAGTGLRADLSDGRSLSGGVGFLMDAGGDDRYEAQVFCQGTGFLEGVGMLVDGGGSDEYSGIWYAQASAAHRAAGVLIDRGSEDDSYRAEQYTSLCAAHDNSMAYLHNEGGNDSYRVGNLGIAGANDNGVAIMVEEGGDDRYEIDYKEGYGLGAAKISHWGTSREASLGLGLLFELGGEDTYATEREGPKNNGLTRWQQKYPELDLRSELGLLVDGEYESPFYLEARTESDGYDENILQDTRETRRQYREKIPEYPEDVAEEGDN